MKNDETERRGLYHITLLRHGESTGNAGGYLQGQADFPLSDTGRNQAEALAGRWLTEEVTFDRIISSPLLRARETAEIIAGRLASARNPGAIPIEFDPVWMERDWGLISGLHRSEAEERFPRPEFIPTYQPIGVTGESQWELYLRAGRGIQALMDKPAGRYLVVSHGGILNVAMYAILGITPQANFHGARFRFRNTAFAKLVYDPSEHVWLVEGFNDYAHWGFRDGE
jgi:broad specificity phosphatase PhoE